MNKYKFYWNYNVQYVQQVLQDICATHDLQIEISNISYVNDNFPSLQLKCPTDVYQLFLPNSYENDGENRNYFMLIYDADYGLNTTNYAILSNLDDVVKLLINNQNLIK
mgnify:CR=1 FL=1